MKRFGLACLLLMALEVSAVEQDSATTVAVERERSRVAAPQTRVTDVPNAILLALKQNDFAAFIDATEENKDIAELADEWNRHAVELRELNASAKVAEAVVVPGQEGIDRAAVEPPESERLWKQLQSEQGVEALVADWQPKIAANVSQRLMEFNLGFGALLTSIATDQELSAVQVQQLTQLMYAVQDWSGRVDFADSDRLRRALGAVARLVRQTGVDRFDDVQQLAFEDAMVHGDALLRTVKQVLLAYDIDADQILNSVRLSEVDAAGQHATLHIELRMFGVDLSHDVRQTHVGGRWVDASVADQATHEAP